MSASNVQRDSKGRFITTDHARYEKRPDGYCRWRSFDPSLGDDVYLYVHQLLACVEFDPADVFDPSNHVHHINGVRWLNLPDNIELRDDAEHGNYHMNGVEFE